MRSKTIMPTVYSKEGLHPGFSIDCVILSYDSGQIKVLLNQFDEDEVMRVLPGGFMLNDEDAEQALCRILKQRTGLVDVFLKQFYTFTDPTRTNMEQNMEFLKRHNLDIEKYDWLLKRFVSLGYYALVKFDEIDLKSIGCGLNAWYNINELPDLYTDHKFIIKKAIKSIQELLPIIAVGYELLPTKFTMPDLRSIYEIILEKDLDRRNFQKKILAEGMVEELDEKIDSKAYNPPKLYSFAKGRKDIFLNTIF